MKLFRANMYNEKIELYLMVCSCENYHKIYIKYITDGLQYFRYNTVDNSAYYM